MKLFKIHLTVALFMANCSIVLVFEKVIYFRLLILVSDRKKSYTLLYALACEFIQLHLVALCYWDVSVRHDVSLFRISDWLSTKKTLLGDFNSQKSSFLVFSRWATIASAHQIWWQEIERSRKVTVLLKGILLVLWIPYFPAKNVLRDKNETFSTGIFSCRFSSSRFSWPFKNFKESTPKTVWLHDGGVSKRVCSTHF